MYNESLVIGKVKVVYWQEFTKLTNFWTPFRFRESYKNGVYLKYGPKSRVYFMENFSKIDWKMKTAFLWISQEFHIFSLEGIHIVSPDCSWIMSLTFSCNSSGVSPWTTAVKYSPNSCSNFMARSYNLRAWNETYCKLNCSKAGCGCILPVLLSSSCSSPARNLRSRGLRKTAENIADVSIPAQILHGISYQ